MLCPPSARRSPPARSRASTARRARRLPYGEPLVRLWALPLPPEPLTSRRSPSSLRCPPRHSCPSHARSPRTRRGFRRRGRHRGAAPLGRDNAGQLSVLGCGVEGWRPPRRVGLGASAILLGALVVGCAPRPCSSRSRRCGRATPSLRTRQAATSPPTCSASPPPRCSSPFAVGRGKGTGARRLALGRWDLAASAADTRRHSVVLMAGIAAGHSARKGDGRRLRRTRALRELVLERAERTGVPATSSSGDQARCAANAAPARETPTRSTRFAAWRGASPASVLRSSTTLAKARSSNSQSINDTHQQRAGAAHHHATSVTRRVEAYTGSRILSTCTSCSVRSSGRGGELAVRRGGGRLAAQLHPVADGRRPSSGWSSDFKHRRLEGGAARRVVAAGLVDAVRAQHAEPAASAARARGVGGLGRA